MRLLRCEVILDLDEDGQESLLEALQAALDYFRDPAKGFDTLPQAAVFGTNPGAILWNRGLGIRAVLRGGIHKLAGTRWLRQRQDAPPRTHADVDEREEIWLK